MEAAARLRPLLRPRRFCCFAFLLALAACTAVQYNEDAPAVSALPAAEAPAAAVPAATVLFINKTPFTVRLVRGSGRTDAALIAPFSSERVFHDFTKEESYYPLFDIPLIPSYSLSRLRPEDRDWYYTVDSVKAEQEIEIVTPPGFDDTAAYIVFTNKGARGGVSLSRNESNNRMTGINFSEAKSNVNDGETMVYREDPRELRSLRVQPGNIGFGEIRFRPSFVYSFIFDGQALSLSDARPLHRVGESSWRREIPQAVLYSGDPEKDLSLAALSGNRLAWYRLNREGLEPGESRSIGENEYVDLKTVTAAGPGRFIAAGGVDSLEGAFNDPAYTAWIGELGDSLVWETDLGQFETGSLNRYGPVLSLAREGDRYRFCGELIVWDTWDDPLPGAYAGSFRLVEGRPVFDEAPVLFEGLSFTQVLCAKENGGFYLAGKRGANDRIAALVKSFDSGGRELWEFSPPLPGNSWYQCGFIDEDEGRIILAGTLGARDLTGEGGRPFIQASLKTGETQWLRILEEDVFKDMNLVTSIVGAGEYGYAITLSRTGGGHLAARVNEVGRYIP